MNKMERKEVVSDVGKLRYSTSIQPSTMSALDMACLRLGRSFKQRDIRPDEILLLVAMTYIVIYFILRPIYLARLASGW
jgi:hypothetical protein